MDRFVASLRPIALAGALALVAAACTSGPAQWTFAPTPPSTPSPSASASASSSASASPAASATASSSPAASGSATAGCAPDDAVVQIQETAQLTMVPNAVTVPAGKKVCFQVTNSAGFTHNFYVGPSADIEARNQTAAVAGIPDFSSGTMTLEWAPSGSGPFEYACWIPGHLEAGMKGTVTIQ